MKDREYTQWGNVKGEPMSGREAQRRDDWLEAEEWDEANRNLSYDELKDLGIPRLSIARLRSCDLHRHPDPDLDGMVGPIYGGLVRRGL